jgi:hypothetical protein
MGTLRLLLYLGLASLFVGSMSCASVGDGFGEGQGDDDDVAGDDDDDVADDDDDDTTAADDDDDVADDDDATTGSTIGGEISLGGLQPESGSPWHVIVAAYNDVDFEPDEFPTAAPVATDTLQTTEMPVKFELLVEFGLTYGVAAFLDDNGSGTDAPDTGDLVGQYPDYVEAPASELLFVLDQRVE